MRRDFSAPAGTVKRMKVESAVLKGNPLGDPIERPHRCLHSSGHDGRGAAVACRSRGLHRGRAGAHQLAQLSREHSRAGGSADCDRRDAALRDRVSDCFTKLGGNQYINSAGVGRWADFLLQEACRLWSGGRLAADGESAACSAKAPAVTAP
jgi:hypothetical protein